MSSRPTVNAVIQARLSSSRLRGKVLRQLGGKTVLAWVVDAARRAPGVDNVVVATSTGPEDDAVAEEALRCEAGMVRGPLDDVLTRFSLAVAEFPCDAIVRLTADCPLLDPVLIGQVAGLWRADTGLDYVSNTLVRTFPRGLDAELVRADVLAEQVRIANGADRIHVTSGVYRDPERYLCAGVVGGMDNSDLRVTVDTDQDAAVVDAVVEALGAEASRWPALVEFLRKHPDIAALNSTVEQKAHAAG